MDKADPWSDAHDEDVLNLIGDDPTAKKDIASILGITGSAVNQIIKRLHDSGQVICINGKFKRKTTGETKEWEDFSSLTA
jgi:Mn-dependent DtxR family transcriptional regulator